MITYFNPKYLEYLLLQRTRLKTEYNITEKSKTSSVLRSLNEMTKKDYEMIIPFLKNSLKTNKYCHILDIGCGLGTIDVYLSNNINKSIIYAQDKTDNISAHRKYNGFNQEYFYYNNLDLLNDFLSKNNVKNYQIIKGEDLFEYHRQFDIIISLLSCGWHYSLNVYLEYIKNHLTPNGQLVVDVRNNTEEHLLYKNFHNVNRCFNENEKTHDNSIVGYRYICSKLK